VHRDVKPGNFLFSRKQRLGYLVDFNLAMVVSKSGRSRRGEVIRESSTAIGKVLGKRPCKDTSESCLSKRQQTISRYRAYSHPILLKSDPPLYLKLWNAQCGKAHVLTSFLSGRQCRHVRGNTNFSKLL
jgi:serine/threonine protein kinase